MDLLNQNVPNAWQWLGLLATFAGTGLAFWAAISARGARQQARAAKEAAIRLGHVVQLGDLIADMQELQQMLARKDFEAIAAKCATLRGRIVRFKAEMYNLPEMTERAGLDLARDHLEAIGKVALGRASEARRTERIQIAFAYANEALNNLFAAQHAEAYGEGS
jgi:hypothetical protein